MTKFKNGARVRLTSDDYCLAKGSVGTVREDYSACPFVAWDGFTEGGSGYDDGSENQLAVDEDNLELAEPPRPRFMTAWMEDAEQPFTPTGEAFWTLEDAEAFARYLLARNERPNEQIAVFEIRSVHLARLTITSEKA